MQVSNDQQIAFHRLHASGCFVMPNPWDAGSARALEQMGFKALATTSAGFAWTLGPRGQPVTLDQALEHLREIVAAVKVPVNADFEGGFAVDPQQVAANVKLAAATGIAGLSIEDSTGDEASPLYEFDLAVERVRAARRAIDESGTGIVLTGRSEGFVCGRPDIDETIRRLRAYAEAGADCLYAPRIDTDEHVAAIVAAVSPKPVNLLINAPFMTVARQRLWACGGSAWAARSRARHGLDSCKPRRRSRRPARSPGSTGCRMSMHCFATDRSCGGVSVKLRKSMDLDRDARSHRSYGIVTSNNGRGRVGAGRRPEATARAQDLRDDRVLEPHAREQGDGDEDRCDLHQPDQAVVWLAAGDRQADPRRAQQRGQQRRVGPSRTFAAHAACGIVSRAGPRTWPQLLLRLGVRRVGDDAVGRADVDALRIVVRADAFGALGRIDDVDRRCRR